MTFSDLDDHDLFVHDSCMSKTITIDDDAYKLLASLKQNGRDSFTRVILRHVYRPAETCGELLEMTENDPPPAVDPDVLNRVAKGRGRRSGGRK
jgi:predicted CopG family antitoxin